LGEEDFELAITIKFLYGGVQDEREEGASSFNALVCARILAGDCDPDCIMVRLVKNRLTNFGHDDAMLMGGEDVITLTFLRRMKV